MITLAELATLLQGEWQGKPDTPLNALRSLTSATHDDLTYYDNPVFLPHLKQTKAAAVLLPTMLNKDWHGNVIIVKDPIQALSRAKNIFQAQQQSGQNIHPSTVIHDSTILPDNLLIGPGVVIGENVQVGEGVSIAANTMIAAGCKLGDHCRIGSQVTIHEGSFLAERVHIDSGSIIGSSPFNFQKSAGEWLQGAALGCVMIGSDVCIGANCCVDRGSLADTIIEDAVVMDNLVHIAHDVRIGHHTAIAAAVVIGACAVVGSHNILGGASCIGPNVQLCNDLVITGRSTVAKNIKSPGVYSSGTMVTEHRRWRRNASRFRYLDEYIRRLNKLEQAMMRESND